jgi:hypothetical protein
VYGSTSRSQLPVSLEFSLLLLHRGHQDYCYAVTATITHTMRHIDALWPLVAATCHVTHTLVFNVYHPLFSKVN